MGDQVLVSIQRQGVINCVINMFYHAVPGTFVRPGAAVDLGTLHESLWLLQTKLQAVSTDREAPGTVNKICAGHMRPDWVERWGRSPEKCGI